MTSFMTIEDFAKHLAVSQKTVHRLIRNGLPSLLIGRSRRIKKEEAEKWIELSYLMKRRTRNKKQ
jgi:excisionase family DNA binding protein